VDAADRLSRGTSSHEQRPAASGSDGTPTVTVVIPVYNGGRTIGPALQSVFDQTYTDYEVIVVDDGSTDDTAAEVARWAGHVRYERQANGGPARARNKALRLARGRFVAFLDADDVWLPRKLERQIAYFAEHPDTGLLHTAAMVSRAPTRTALEALDTPSREAINEPPARVYCDLFHSRLDINTLTVMARRDVLLECGGFNERRELHVEDWDLWLRIASRYPIGYIDLPLAVHRPGGGMSSAVEKTFRGQQIVISEATPLCRAACERHAAAPDECLRQREYRLYSELGYERFWSGREREAREAFGQAVHLDPDAARPRWYYGATFVGRRWLEPLRRLRRALRGGKKPPAARPPVNLCEDTAFRRARTAAVSVVHRLDDATARIGRTKQRILFEAASPLSLVVARPVLDILNRDPRIELWCTTSDQAWDSASIFASAGLTGPHVSPASARRMKFEAYINTDFWNMTWLPRRTRRIHLFHGVAGKYGLDAPTGIAPVVSSFDRLMFPNRDRLGHYAEAGLVDPDSAVAALIGYPKVDCLVDGSLDRTAIQERLGLDPSVPTVLYAPTWSPYSSLNESGEAIIAALAQRRMNVIVKLHDRSYDSSDRASGGVDWRSCIEDICRRHGAHLAQDFDVSPYLYVADALVTDHSSVGFEFMLLNRPLVLVDQPALIANARVSEGKVALMRSAAEVVPAAAVADAVERGLDCPSRFGERRRDIASQLFYRPGGASARAVQCVYSLLELSLPEAAPAVSRAVAVSPGVRVFESRRTNHA